MISLKVMLMVLMAEVELPPHTAAQLSSTYPYEIGANVSSTAKIIIVALISCMFLIAFFSLCIRTCLDNFSPETRRQLQLPIVNNHRRRLKLPSGLDKDAVESFPVLLYSDVKELKIGNGGLECAVCISEFADDERLRYLPKCHHVFHPECIDVWLASHATCPVCRSDLTVTNLHADSESRSPRELTYSQQIEESSTESGTQNCNLVHVEEEERGDRKFPRSHSTGHSVVSPGDDCERYTLRLPEEVRKRIVTLKRARSCGGDVGRNSRRSVTESVMGASDGANMDGVSCQPVMGASRLLTPSLRIL